MDWTPLHARLHRTLRQRQLLTKQRLLVAVSGGQDSLCLIKLLLDLQPKWGWHLAIAHCNHCWRPDSQANADHVKHLAWLWSVPFYCITATDVLSSEAQARQWRYQSLAAIAQEDTYQCLVTGHTASDRAETLLYNLVRGSGTDGLQALAWQRWLSPELLLVRPLLDVTRAETAQFCQDFHLPVWEDSTNQDLTYTRNRIRQELLPYLQAHFNPQVESTLAQTAELLRADVEYLEQAATTLLQQAMVSGDCCGQARDTEYGRVADSPQQCQVDAGLEEDAETQRRGDIDFKNTGTRGGGDTENFPDSSSPLAIPPARNPGRSPSPLNQLGLNRVILQKAPLALQRRVIRQFLQQVLPSNPNFDHIEKLLALITAANRSRSDPFPGGSIAEVEGPWIWWTKV